MEENDKIVSSSHLKRSLFRPSERVVRKGAVTRPIDTHRVVELTGVASAESAVAMQNGNDCTPDLMLWTAGCAWSKPLALAE